VRDAAALLASELVTNAILHANTELAVRALELAGLDGVFRILPSRATAADADGAGDSLTS
jgi:hypothetical protein